MSVKKPSNTEGYLLRKIPGAEHQVRIWFATGFGPTKVAQLVIATFAIPYTKQSAATWRHTHDQDIALLRNELKRATRRQYKQLLSGSQPLQRMRCDDPHCPCRCHAHAPDAAG